MLTFGQKLYLDLDTSSNSIPTFKVLPVTITLNSVTSSSRRGAKYMSDFYCTGLVVNYSDTSYGRQECGGENIFMRSETETMRWC